MATARPSVVAIDGVARRLVEDAECGVFVEPENAGALARVLKELRDDPKRCQRMGESGLRFVRENYDRVKIAKRYIDMIQNEVLPRPKVRAVRSR